MEEYFFIYLGLAFVVASLLGTVFGWISFFKLRKLEQKIFTLSRQLAAGAGAEKKAPSQKPEISEPAATVKKAAPKATPKASPKITVAAAPDKPASSFDALERSLSGNWLVWVGALVLALGGVLLVKYTIEAIHFGPWLRISTAMAAGLAMLASGHWLKRRDGLGARLIRSAAPLALSGAGLITLYGAIYASYALYHLLPAPIAFVLMALIALGGMVLALIHGQLLALIGIGGGYIVPMLVQTQNPSALALFGYVFLVAATGMLLARQRQWRISGLVAVSGVLLWPLLWLANTSAQTVPAGDATILVVFLFSIMGLGVALHWRNAAQLPLSVRHIRQWSAPYINVMTLALSLALVFFFLIRQSDYLPFVVMAFALLCAGTLMMAWRREGLGWLPVFPALAAFFVLLYWPAEQADIINDTVRLNRFLGVPGAGPDGLPFVSTLLGFAALYGLGGYLAQARLGVRGIMASLSAFMPLALLFVAYWRVNGLQHDWQMTALALVLSLAQVMVLENFARKSGGMEAHPGPATAYALGCNGALALALAMSMGQVWLSVGLAMQVPVMALLWGRLKVPVLKPAALTLAVLVVLRLTIFGEAFERTIGEIPVFNWLLWGYGLPALALMVSAKLFLRAETKANSYTIQGLQSAAMVCAIALLMLETHHFMSGGKMTDLPMFSEWALYLCSWLAIAVLFYWRMGPNLPFAQRWGRRLLLVLSGPLMLFLGLLNPWAEQASGIGPLPVFNPLALAYLIPGVLLLVQASLYRQQGRDSMALLFSLVGLVELLLWQVLEVRRAFHASALHEGPISNGESYSYSAVVLIYALVILAAGFWRRLPYLRHTALGLVILVTLKIFIYDLSALQGLLRGLSFLGLGAVLMGIALIYQKLILPAQALETQHKTGSPPP
jgi:uncharacterized membrane protein